MEYQQAGVLSTRSMRNAAQRHTIAHEVEKRAHNSERRLMILSCTELEGSNVCAKEKCVSATQMYLDRFVEVMICKQCKVLCACVCPIQSRLLLLGGRRLRANFAALHNRVHTMPQRVCLCVSVRRPKQNSAPNSTCLWRIHCKLQRLHNFLSFCTLAICIFIHLCVAFTLPSPLPSTHSVAVSNRQPATGSRQPSFKLI